ncbi:unnamed protein product [Fusarium graminearum]|uniref:Chromosome 4, complete genome n=2 Tax=Gibberella zeae TaxID=5518 RepID=A0A098DU81_GIBZE|nr:unnamed protein product [Fusarium graminearum]CAF3473053.1 unnamed protein product [Fusarium graminearum]CAF3508195.1 unnamed protein product [Fusarium graminearum]CAG1979309.1 unnamed protein product [Fusarium graminearum]CAG1993436.1 unnamed protein product [Fusarium graminearum]
MSEAMPLPYTTVTSWPPGTYHGPRGPTHPQSIPQYEHQLHHPASYNGGAPENRRPSQLQTSQHPRTSHVHQIADMSSSIPQNPYPPPPLGVHPHYSVSNMTGYHERFGSRQGHHSAHPSQSHSTPGEQMPSLANVQPVATNDVQPSHLTGYQFDPRAPPTASGPHDLVSPMMSPAEIRPDHMRISDLVASGRSNAGAMYGSTQPHGISYSLKIRQQPVAARSCGFGERDRRVIDPPPIVQLIIEGPNLTKDELSKHLRYPHYVMSCSIVDETGAHDASFMPEEYRQQRRLMGSLVNAPFVGKDEHGEEGTFFCFADLSCRTPGSFRLKFSMAKIDPLRGKEQGRFPNLAQAQTEVFTVYTAKDFPGMQASTKLTKRLKEQGCIISIKKGNDRSKNARSHDDSSEGDQDDGEIAAQSKRRRRSTRQ